MSREMFLREFHAEKGMLPRPLESRPQGVLVVSLPHKGEEENVVALHNRRLEGGRVITALHTVRALDVTRIFEVVLKELNDRQRYSQRDASAVDGVNTSSSTTRYPTRNMHIVKADEVSRADSDHTQAEKVSSKSLPGSQTPLNISFQHRKGKGWLRHEYPGPGFSQARDPSPRHCVLEV